MSSERDSRARAAARARLERQMAARREAARRRRVLQTRIAAGVAAVVVVGAATWIVISVLDRPAAPAAQCLYPVTYPAPTAEPTLDSSASVDPSATAGATDEATATTDASATPDANATPTPTAAWLPDGIQDVGLPPSDPPREGYQVMTLDTNLGVIEIEMDLSKTPCTANSFAYLAGKGFFDNPTGDLTSCHRMVPDIFALQCGDPSATGYGGPNYSFAAENLQQDKLPAYHDGDVAMAHGQSLDSNGSQFFFVYGVGQLPGDYPLFGHVIKGMDIVRQVAAGDYDPTTEEPLVKIVFKTVTVGPISPDPFPRETPMQTPAASPTVTASAT